MNTQTVKRVVFWLIVFPALLMALTAFSPFRQVPVPNPDSYLIYGIPWMLVGMVLVGLAQKYLNIAPEAGTLAKAAWAAVGYLVLQMLPDIETVAPWLPKYLPMVLATILIFGSELGLVPGTTAKRVTSLFVRKDRLY